MKKTLFYQTLMIIISFQSTAIAASQNDTISELNSQAPTLDLDQDGKPDTWRKFNAQGDLIETSYDLNDDAKPDEWLVRSETTLTRTRALKFDNQVNWRQVTRYNSAGKALDTVTEEVRNGKWVTTETKVHEDKVVY